MIVVAGIALVVMGPEKFPGFAKMALRTFRDLRGYLDDLKTEAAKELRPVQQELTALSKVDPEKYIDALTRDDEAVAPQVGEPGFTERYAASPVTSAATEPSANAAEQGEDTSESSAYREPMPGEDHAEGYPEPKPQASSPAEADSDPLSNLSAPERMDG